MRIEEDIKLDFTDVLIRPKRSTLVSRKNAELDRKFTFKYSKHHWKGVPIAASNMDHTGTIKMSEVLGEAQHGAGTLGTIPCGRPSHVLSNDLR